MSAARSRQPGDGLVGRLGGPFRWLVAGVGIVLFAGCLGLIWFRVRVGLDPTTALGIGITTLLALGVVALGTWLARSSLDDPDVMRATQWALGGLLVLLAANALVLSTGVLRRPGGSGVLDAVTLLLLNAGVGTALGVLAGVYRIRDRLQSARARQLNRAMNAATDGIAIFGPDGRFEYVNAAFAELHGTTVEELVGRTWKELYGEDTIATLRDTIERVRTAGAGWRDTVTARRRNGGSYPQSLSMTAVDDKVVMVARDVTERRERRQRLSVLHRLLRHNLRNQLNIVIGRAEMLQESAPAPARGDAAEIESVAHDLLELSTTAQEVENILDGESTVHPVVVAEHVRSAAEQIRAEAPDVTITVDVPERFSVIADSRLRIAFRELLQNAVEHNDVSEPTVEVSAEAVDEDWVRIRVADNGPGIPDQERAVLVEGREHPLHHGSGLGLWLVHWLVTKSGGRLEFSANEPRGSVVRIDLRRPTSA